MSHMKGVLLPGNENTTQSQWSKTTHRRKPGNAARGLLNALPVEQAPHHIFSESNDCIDCLFSRDVNAHAKHVHA